MAGELLVPEVEFLGLWKKTEGSAVAAIAEIAKHFRCGEVVIARKALDAGKISKDIYNQVVQNAIDNFRKMKENNENSGGNYYNTQGSRLDG